MARVVTVRPANPVECAAGVLKHSRMLRGESSSLDEGQQHWDGCGGFGRIGKEGLERGSGEAK